ncbi:SOS response-associated peptidase family protein [Paenibacillus naphthalenovorans]|uniref:SOS response-associated peptidase family protein n=1 Tax=Paenibacillus naphthalenovorans TaxID=162209 RepID=UPI003D286EAA
MCGRYTLTVTLDELMVHFYSSLSGSVRHQPRFNISPSQTVLAVINDGVHNRIGPLKWGLIPSWSKDDKTALANARAETLKDKPAFKVPFARKRCLIPAEEMKAYPVPSLVGNARNDVPECIQQLAP